MGIQLMKYKTDCFYPGQRKYIHFGPNKAADIVMCMCEMNRIGTWEKKVDDRFNFRCFKLVFANGSNELNELLCALHFVCDCYLMHFCMRSIFNLINGSFNLSISVYIIYIFNIINSSSMLLWKLDRHNDYNNVV